MSLLGEPAHPNLIRLGFQTQRNRLKIQELSARFVGHYNAAELVANRCANLLFQISNQAYCHPPHAQAISSSNRGRRASYRSPRRRL